MNLVLYGPISSERGTFATISLWNVFGTVFYGIDKYRDRRRGPAGQASVSGQSESSEWTKFVWIEQFADIPTGIGM